LTSGSGFPFPLKVFRLVPVEAELQRDGKVPVGRVADAGRDVTSGRHKPVELVVPVDLDVLDDGEDGETKFVVALSSAKRRLVQIQGGVLATKKNVVAVH